MSQEKKAVTLAVPSEDPQKKKEDEAKDGPSKPNGEAKATGEAKEGEELSEEDLQLKGELEMLVERLKESDTKLYRPALETLRTLIRTSTSSMTSVPKPLKFLRPLYPDLQTLYDGWPASEDKSLFADILSVLAMTYSDTQPRGTLRYRILSASLLPSTSTLSDPGSWGHEYVRHLAAELGEEYTERIENQQDATKALGTVDELHALAMECATFLLGHNAEPDAVDLLEEMEIVDRIVERVDENTYGRVCQYMIRCVNLLPPPDDLAFLRTAHKIYVQHQRFPEALALAIRLNDRELIREDFEAPGNPLMKRQLAFLIARAQVPLEWLKVSEDEAEEVDPSDVLESFEDDLRECLTNTKLSPHFRAFGKEVGVEEAKTLEDVYKSHLETTRAGATQNVDSARANLAGVFVNAFVNAGFANDELIVKAERGKSFMYKQKTHGILSATASIGVCCLWETDESYTLLDSYTYNAEEYMKAGALLGWGIVSTGVRTEVDASKALLETFLDNNSALLKTSAIMGLGFAYCGAQRQDVMELLLPFVSDDGVNMEIASLAALSLGFVFVGSANGEIAGTILQMLMEREDKQLDEKWARFMALGLALLYLGTQEDSDATIETLKAIPHPIGKQAQILVDICSFAGTGNVLKVQAMLHHCDEHIVKEKKEEKKDEKEETKDEKKEENEEEVKLDDTFQAFAVIGIALVAMGEDIGAEMCLRQLNHLMHYGEPVIRKTVPLALGLVSASNPQLPILDTLSKYSHDNDLAVALNAIFAMGLVGAGTNNARLAQMLRQLAGYYYKEPDCLFMVRIAQGLVHMGKGTIGINPFFADRSVMSRTAVAGLLATLTAFTDAKAFVLDKYHWMLYFLVPAMYPRMLITLDENLENKPVTVRVGQAVDVVGQAGKPRTISGFQTHTTPVRMATTERAELATEEFIPFAHVLEGFVILQQNPGWEKEDKMEL